MRPWASKVPKNCFNITDKLARVEIKIDFSSDRPFYFRLAGFVDFKFQK